MISMAILSGRSNEPLARSIAARLNMPLTPVIIDCYSSGENRVEVLHSVRNRTVFIVQSGYSYDKDSPTPNDYIMETIMLADTCFHSSAKDIVLLMPCLPYCDENNEDAFGEPINIDSIGCTTDLQKWLKESLFNVSPESVDDPILYQQLKEHHERVPKPILRPLTPMTQTNPLKLIAKLLTCTGISKLLTFALPRPQLVGFFDIPVDALPIAPILSFFLKNRGGIENYTIAASDLGLAKNVSQIAKTLNRPFALMHKLPVQDGFSCSGENIQDLNVLLIDEIGKRAFEAAKAFKKRNCSSVSLFVSHAVFISPGTDIPEFLENSSLFNEIILTNSIRVPEYFSKLTNIIVLDLTDYFAEAVKCIINGNSLNEMQNIFLK